VVVLDEPHPPIQQVAVAAKLRAASFSPAVPSACP